MMSPQSTHFHRKLSVATDQKFRAEDNSHIEKDKEDVAVAGPSVPVEPPEPVDPDDGRE